VTLPLEGLVGIVTGAGHGIGEAHARALAAAGAAVVVNDAGVGWSGKEDNATRAHDVVESIREAGGRATAHVGDVGSADGARTLVDTALNEFGAVNILVCNAGITRLGRTDTLREADFDAVHHVHVKGTFLPTRSVVRHWRDRSALGEQVYGRIITTTSGAALHMTENMTSVAYASAKAAILGFSLTLAGELLDLGVTVNCLSPGALTHGAESKPEWMRDPVELARQEPERVSPIAVYLASPDAADITGALFGARSGEFSLYEGYRVIASASRDEVWPVADVATWVEEVVGRRYRPPALEDVGSPEATGGRRPAPTSDHS